MSALPADRTPDMLGEAMALADLGFRVIPIKPGGKHPPVPAWVTRRHIDTWTTLKPGDHLTLIEKGMGLPKGTKQVVLAEVEITDVHVERLVRVEHLGELEREGLPDMTPDRFMSWWASGHGYRVNKDGWLDRGTRQLYVTVGMIPCRRIEWRYLP